MGGGGQEGGGEKYPESRHTHPEDHQWTQKELLGKADHLARELEASDQQPQNVWQAAVNDVFEQMKGLSTADRLKLIDLMNKKLKSDHHEKDVVSYENDDNGNPTAIDFTRSDHKTIRKSLDSGAGSGMKTGGDVGVKSGH